jgi:hypothetical protein
MIISIKMAFLLSKILLRVRDNATSRQFALRMQPHNQRRRITSGGPIYEPTVWPWVHMSGDDIDCEEVSELRLALEAMGRPERFTQWGFAVYQTTYPCDGFDYKWIKALENIRNGIRESVFADDLRTTTVDNTMDWKWWAYFRLFPISNDRTLEDRKLLAIHPLFRAWALENLDPTYPPMSSEEMIFKR